MPIDPENPHVAATEQGTQARAFALGLRAGYSVAAFVLFATDRKSVV